MALISAGEAVADVYTPLATGYQNDQRDWAKILPIFPHLPQMPIDPRLSAKEVFEIHKAAVTRDFVAKPRLGKRKSWSCSIKLQVEMMSSALTNFCFAFN